MHAAQLYIVNGRWLFWKSSLIRIALWAVELPKKIVQHWSARGQSDLHANLYAKLPICMLRCLTCVTICMTCLVQAKFSIGRAFAHAQVRRVTPKGMHLTPKVMHLTPKGMHLTPKG